MNNPEYGSYSFADQPIQRPINRLQTTPYYINYPMLLVNPQTGQQFYATPYTDSTFLQANRDIPWWSICLMFFVLCFFALLYIKPTFIQDTGTQQVVYSRLLLLTSVITFILFISPFVYRLIFPIPQ